MDKQLKDMVQICPNTQPIYGQIYPTDQRKPAEWYIGRPGTPYQFRFFMSDLHVREMLATVPKELRDDQADIEGLETRIREEVKEEYDQEIARLNAIIEQMSFDMENDYDNNIEQNEGLLMDRPFPNTDEIIIIPKLVTEEMSVLLPDKVPAPEVFRCLDTGDDFPTLEALQEHQAKLAQKSVQPEPKKKLTAQERLDQRRGRT